jgi:hypothetical protein
MSQNDSTENKNLFDELGLSVQESNVEVGQIYPIYGSITKFINMEPGNVVVIINNQIEARMSLDDIDKIDILSRRAFDPGIFVCTITQTDPEIKADCTTVVFGKNTNAVQ